MKKREQQSISGLAALVLFAVFAVGAVSVLLSGANAYKRLTVRDLHAYETRTAVQFVANKVRQAPSAAAVSLDTFGDADALVIRQKVEEQTYLTRVYCYDGWLMELFTAADGTFLPEDGERILPMESLRLSREESLLTVVLTDDDGTERELRLQLRHGEGGYDAG